MTHSDKALSRRALLRAGLGGAAVVSGLAVSSRPAEATQVAGLNWGAWWPVCGRTTRTPDLGNCGQARQPEIANELAGTGLPPQGRTPATDRARPSR
ncbi:hypothetical protein GCM10023195_21980 [Actinoallomurus liliacearum]|uniref:Uncharacterized protein n=1 Tax=Actinoallomurus liliacearum TaxID=1080073 RepID=A0ABP8TGS7_9ACTN